MTMAPRRAATVIAGPAAALLLWQLAAVLGLTSTFLPAPTAVAEAGWQLAVDGDLGRHVLASLRRVMIGFAVAAVSGVGLGLLLGLSRGLRGLVQPLVELLRPIPPIAWVPLAILWLGLGDGSAVFIVWIGAFFPICVATLDAVTGLDDSHSRVTRTLGFSRRQVVVYVVLPKAAPQIATGVRIGLAGAWISVIAAELVGAQEGLGYLLQQSRLMLQIEQVIVGMAVIGLLGLTMSVVLSRAQRRLMPWATAGREDGSR